MSTLSDGLILIHSVCYSMLKYALICFSVLKYALESQKDEERDESDRLTDRHTFDFQIEERQVHGGSQLSIYQTKS